MSLNNGIKLRETKVERNRLYSRNSRRQSELRLF